MMKQLLPLNIILRVKRDVVDHDGKALVRQDTKDDLTRGEPGKVWAVYPVEPRLDVPPKLPSTMTVIEKVWYVVLLGAELAGVRGDHLD